MKLDISKLSWRTKLITLFTLILGVSLLFQVFYMLLTIRNRETEMTKTHQEEIGRNIGRDLDIDLLRNKNKLGKIAERAEFRNMDLAAQQRTMIQHMEISALISSLYVMDADGWFVSGSEEDTSAYTTQSYVDRPYFTVPFEDGETYYGSPRFYAQSGIIGTSVSVPIESDTGERVGVLIGGVILNEMIDSVANYPLDKGYVAYLVDHKGTVVAHSEVDLFSLEEGPLSLDFSDKPAVQPITEGEKSGSLKYELDGVPFFCSYYVLESNGWGVVVSSPLSVILADINPLFNRLLIINIILFTFAAVFTLLLTRRITESHWRAEKALHKSSSQIIALRQVGLEIASNLDLDELLQSIITNAIDLLDAVGGGIYLYYPERDELEWTISAGACNVPVGSILNRGEGLSGRVLESKQPLIIADYNQWEGKADTLEFLGKSRSVIGVPVSWGKNFIGVLNISRYAPKNFSQTDAELLSLFANQAAIAIQNARLFQSEQEERALAETLRDAASSLSSTLDFDEVLDRILDNIEKVIPCGVANLMLIEDGEIRIIKGRGYSEDQLEILKTNLMVKLVDSPILRRMAETGQPLAISDTRAHSDWMAIPETEWIRSYAGAPITIRGKTIGFLNLDSATPGDFTLTHAKRLQVFADQAAVAIENSRLFQSEKEQRDLAEALRDTSTALGSTLDFDEVLDRILDNIGKVVPHEIANLMLIEDGKIRIVKSRSYSEDQLEKLAKNVLPKLVDSPIMRLMAETGQPIVISDTREYHDWVATPETEWIRSYVAAPIRIKGETVGFINLDSATPGDFAPVHAERLQALADQAAVAIENSRLYESAQHEITERKLTEESLRESESRHRSLFEDSPISLWEEDFTDVKLFIDELRSNGIADIRAYFEAHPEAVSHCASLVKVVDVNQATLDLYQAEDIETLLNGINLTDVFEQFREELIAFAEGKRQYDGEIIMKTIPGERKNAWMKLSTAPGYEQTWAKVFFTIIDITKRVQAEEALQRLNTELSQYVNRLERHNTEVTLLNQVGDLLQSCQTPEEAYAVIEEYAGKLFPELMGALFVLNETKDLLAAVSAWGGSNLRNETFAPETCWAMRRGRVHAAEAGSRLHCRHVRDEEEGGEFRPYICVPLSTQGELLGMLHLSTAPGQTIGEWKQLAMTVAERTALAISNLRMREKLRMDSILDPLTDLFNRRFLDTMLERELLRAARRQRPVSVAMIDLDNLKQVNDVLGHGAGDVLLQELGRFFEASIRKEDFVCRYGGDEFTITFPEMALEDAHKRLEKLRKGVKKLNIQYRDQTLEAVTVSIGVACYPQDGETVAALLKAADQALYRSKEQGRDRVIATGG